MTEPLSAEELRIAHTLPPGALQWLLNAMPDPLWNNGARAMAYRALENRGLMTIRGGLSERGWRVRQYLLRTRGKG